MNNSINNFNLGDIVTFILADGSLGQDGVVVAKDTRSLSVLFEDETREKTISPERLKNNTKRN